MRTQAVLSQDVLDTVPTGKTIQGFAAMILGASDAGTDDSSTILGVVATYPTNFLNPSAILSPRLFKFGAQIDF